MSVAPWLNPNVTPVTNDQLLAIQNATPTLLPRLVRPSIKNIADATIQFTREMKKSSSVPSITLKSASSEPLPQPASPVPQPSSESSKNREILDRSFAAGGLGFSSENKSQPKRKSSEMSTFLNHHPTDINETELSLLPKTETDNKTHIIEQSLFQMKVTVKKPRTFSIGNPKNAAKQDRLMVPLKVSSLYYEQALLRELLPHQVVAFFWILSCCLRHAEDEFGGFMFLDASGLGKTLVMMLALLELRRLHFEFFHNWQQKKCDSAWYYLHNSTIANRAQLHQMCPFGFPYQPLPFYSAWLRILVLSVRSWDKEIEVSFGKSWLRKILRYSKHNRTLKFHETDWIAMDYDLLVEEMENPAPDNPIFSTDWDIVVLDDAHILKSNPRYIKMIQRLNVYRFFFMSNVGMDTDLKLIQMYLQVMQHPQASKNVLFQDHKSTFLSKIKETLVLERTEKEAPWWVPCFNFRKILIPDEHARYLAFFRKIYEWQQSHPDWNPNFAITDYERLSECVGELGIFHLSVQDDLSSMVRNWLKKDFPHPTIQSLHQGKFREVLDLLVKIRLHSEDRVVIMSESVVLLEHLQQLITQQSLQVTHAALNSSSDPAPIVKPETLVSRKNRLLDHLRQILSHDHPLVSSSKPLQLAKAWIQEAQLLEPEVKLERLQTSILKLRYPNDRKETISVRNPFVFCPLQPLRVVESFLLEETDLSCSQLQMQIQYVQQALSSPYQWWFSKFIWNTQQCRWQVPTVDAKFFNVEVLIQSLHLLQINPYTYPGAKLLLNQLKEWMTKFWSSKPNLPFVILYYVARFVSLTEENILASTNRMTQHFLGAQKWDYVDMIFDFIVILQHQKFICPPETKTMNPRQIFLLLSNEKNNRSRAFFETEILPTLIPLLSLLNFDSDQPLLEPLLQFLELIRRTSDFPLDFFKNHGFPLATIQNSIFLCPYTVDNPINLSLANHLISLQFQKSFMTQNPCLKLGQFATLQTHFLLLCSTTEHLTQDQIKLIESKLAGSSPHYDKAVQLRRTLNDSSPKIRVKIEKPSQAPLTMKELQNKKKFKARFPQL